MNSNEFGKIRHYLGKTQSQLAQLLGVSPKAIQSFEQGWRNIPSYIERHLLFLIFMENSLGEGRKSCWERRNCSIEIRQNCPAWEFRMGHFCWFVNGTICQGIVQESWQKKMKLCRQCEIYQSSLPVLDSFQ